ncbi:MAG: DUF1905 domain-containing protein [Burkholderiales bacterium]|jgi:hypothetical protein|nr:DUF1905 domain-containing protein [Burkholderiales bacterium]
MAISPDYIEFVVEQVRDCGAVRYKKMFGESSWSTSLLPMVDGTRFIALLAKVRAKEKLSRGDDVKVSFEL